MKKLVQSVIRMIKGVRGYNESGYAQLMAYKIIRMAQNYGESDDALRQRIREESLRYRQFKKKPERLGKLSFKTKRVDSNETVETDYEINLWQKATLVCQTCERSADVVLEFFVHNKRGERLFAIARTYSDWIGRKEFDLGGGCVFYLYMSKANPGYVLVEAGFYGCQRG